MKINWPLRYKNKHTLVGIVSILALLANQICGFLGLDYSNEIKQIVDIITTILTLLAGLGVLIDPTTEGLNDSEYSNQKTEPSSNDVKVIADEGEITETSDVTVEVENGGGMQ